MTEQELQNQIASMKIRLFDAGEQMQQAQATIQQLQQTLGEIASVAGVKPDADNNITLASVVEAVRELAPSTQPAEPELLEG